MQTIKNIRIDVRLIHGQVAAVWINTLGVTRIMVVDSKAPEDKILVQALKLACPANVKLSILSPAKAAANLNDNKYDGDNIMIVVKSPKSLIELYDAGYHMEQVNVGNMANRTGSKILKKTVSVTPEDVEDFKTLMSRGVKFTASMLPGEQYDFEGAIRDIKF